MNDAASKPAPSQLVRLVRVAKLLGAALPAGQERGNASQWTDAMDGVWQRNGGPSGHAGRLIEQVRDGLKAVSDAFEAEGNASNAKLIQAARARYAANAKTLRAQAEGLLLDIEERIAEQRAAVSVDETHVTYPALAPVAIVKEVLAERGIAADFSQRIKSADLKTFRAPLTNA